MKNAIEFVPVGECKVNREMVVKKWTLLCRISRWHDKYTLIEYTPKMKKRLKVSISSDDAKYLIDTLGLRCVKSEIFNHAYTYLSV